MNTTSRQRPSQAASPLVLFSQSVFPQYLWLAVYACAVAGGCSSKPTPAEKQAADARAHEASAAAIDSSDVEVRDGKLDAVTQDVPALEEADHPCGCSTVCPCSKDRCLCATGKTCGPTCTCQPKAAHDWREVYSAGHWWYYQPDKTWLIWDGKRWVKWQEHKPTAGQRQGGKTNWFGEPKVIRPWRNGLFMGADTGQSNATACRT